MVFGLKFPPKKLLITITLGLLIRFLIMPFAGHWDLTSLNQVALSLYTDGIKYAYNYYYAIYPPFAYLFLGFWQKLISVFLFNDFSSLINSEVLYSFSDPHIYRYLFFLKLPYLFFDLGIGLLLYLMQSKQKKDQILALWLFNPITLYATFAWGTLDIIPTFLCVLALYLAEKKHPIFGAIALGFGASFKAFPLLLLVPYCLLAIKDSYKKRLFAVISGALPFVLILLPFLGNADFVTRFFSSDQMQIIQHAGFYIGRNDNLSLYYIFYVFLIFALYHFKIREEKLSWVFFLIIFMFYAFSAFTPQWFVWGLPFLLLVAVNQGLSNKWLLLLVLLYFSLVIFFEITLNFGLFAPMEVTLLDFPSLGDKIGSFIDIHRLNGIIRSVMSGLFLWLIFITKPKNLHEDI